MEIGNKKKKEANLMFVSSEICEAAQLTYSTSQLQYWLPLINPALVINLQQRLILFSTFEEILRILPQEYSAKRNHIRGCAFTSRRGGRILDIEQNIVKQIN